MKKGWQISASPSLFPLATQTSSLVYEPGGGTGSGGGGTVGGGGGGVVGGGGGVVGGGGVGTGSPAVPPPFLY